MPFMRRFRSEGDWRDWIACGIFDWRAIYITAVGAQSEFRPFDECDFDQDKGIPSLIPAGSLPERRVIRNGNVNIPAECEEFAKGRDLPTTSRNDLPAPFRFLLLTKSEPNRKQVGRMIERINVLGARRIFALKDWSVIRNAGSWVNHYSRLLDAVYEQWIDDTRWLEEKTFNDLGRCNNEFLMPIQANIDSLADDALNRTLDRYRDTPRGRAKKWKNLPRRAD